jgi:hypothetical protein
MNAQASRGVGFAGKGVNLCSPWCPIVPGSWFPIVCDIKGSLDLLTNSSTSNSCLMHNRALLECEIWDASVEGKATRLVRSSVNRSKRRPVNNASGPQGGGSEVGNLLGSGEWSLERVSVSSLFPYLTQPGGDFFPLKSCQIIVKRPSEKENN